MKKRFLTLATVLLFAICASDRETAAQDLQSYDGVFPLRDVGPRVTTNFGARYNKDLPAKDPNNYEDNGKTHLGIDYGAPAGSVVLAPVTGKIVFNKGSSIEEENYVVIRDSAGRDHVLGHFECSYCNGRTKLSPSNGIDVVAGQEIGRVMVDHLHYGLRPADKPIIGAKGQPLDGWGRTDNANFEQKKTSWKSEINLVPSALFAFIGSQSIVVCRSSQNLNAGMSSPFCGSEWVRSNQGRDLRTRQVDPRGNF